MSIQKIVHSPENQVEMHDEYVNLNSIMKCTTVCLCYVQATLNITAQFLLMINISQGNVALRKNSQMRISSSVLKNSLAVFGNQQFCVQYVNLSMH